MNIGPRDLPAAGDVARRWPIILDKGKTVPWTQKGGPSCSPARGRCDQRRLRHIDEFDGQRLAMQWIGIRTPRHPSTA
jgi:alpha-N-arabinofuranosidase